MRKVNFKQIFATLSRILKYVKNDKLLYILGFLGLSSQTFIFNTMMGYGMLRIVGGALEGDTSNFGITLIVVGLVFLGVVVMLSVSNWAFETAVARTTGRIRKALFDRVQKLPVSELESDHSGDMVSRLTNDINTTAQSYGWNLVMPAMAVIGGVGCTALMFVVSWKLTIIIVGFGIISFAANTIFAGPMKKAGDKVQESLSKVTVHMTDILASSTIIKIFNLKKWAMGRFDKANTTVFNWNMRQARLNTGLTAVNQFSGFLSFVGALITGGIFVINKSISFAMSLS